MVKTKKRTLTNTIQRVNKGNKNKYSRNARKLAKRMVKKTKKNKKNKGTRRLIGGVGHKRVQLKQDRTSGHGAPVSSVSATELKRRAIIARRRAVILPQGGNFLHIKNNPMDHNRDLAGNITTAAVRKINRDLGLDTSPQLLAPQIGSVGVVAEAATPFNVESCDTYVIHAHGGVIPFKQVWRQQSIVRVPTSINDTVNGNTIPPHFNIFSLLDKMGQDMGYAFDVDVDSNYLIGKSCPSAALDVSKYSLTRIQNDEVPHINFYGEASIPHSLQTLNWLKNYWIQTHPAGPRWDDPPPVGMAVNDFQQAFGSDVNKINFKAGVYKCTGGGVFNPKPVIRIAMGSKTTLIDIINQIEQLQAATYPNPPHRCVNIIIATCLGFEENA